MFKTKSFLKNVDLNGMFIINFSSILLFLKNVLIQIIHMKFGNNLLEVKYNFLSLMFSLKDDNTHYLLTVNEMLQLITSSQYAFDDFYPTTTIGYLPGRTINLFSTDEADYMRDTFISLENIKKKNIFEYSNFPWKSSRLIRNLIYMIEKKIKELNELYPD